MKLLIDSIKNGLALQSISDEMVPLKLDQQEHLCDLLVPVMMPMSTSSFIMPKLILILPQILFITAMNLDLRFDSGNHLSRELLFCFLACDFQSWSSTSVKNQCEFYDFNCNCQKEEWNKAFVNCSATAEKALKRPNFGKDCLVRKRNDCKCSLYCTNYAHEKSGTRCQASDLNCLCQDQNYRDVFSECPQSSSNSNDCSELLDIECFFAKADRESKMVKSGTNNGNQNGLSVNQTSFLDLITSHFQSFIPHKGARNRNN